MKLTTGNIVKLFSAGMTVLAVAMPAAAGDAAAGKAIYDGKGGCAACHGAAGAGDGAAAAALDPKPASFAEAAFRLDTDGDGQTGSDVDLANSIKYGAAKYGGNAAMPGRADFSDAEVNDLIAYIRSLKK